MFHCTPISKLIILFSLLLVLNSNAQTKKIPVSDSLKTELIKKNNDTTHVTLLLKLSELVANTSQDSAILISTQILDHIKNKISATTGIEKKVLLKRKATALSNLGQFHSNRGEFDKSFTYLNEALKVAKANYDFDNYIPILNNFGQAYIQKGDLPNAKAYLLKCIRVCEILRKPEKKSIPLNNLGVYYIYNSEVDSAINAFKSIKNDSSALLLPQEYGLALNNLGFVYFQYKGLPDTAIVYFKEAMVIFERINDLKNYSSAIANLAATYDDAANYSASTDLYFKALALLEKQGDSHDLATILNNLGMVFSEMKDDEKCMAYLNKALAMAIRMKNEARLVTLYSNIASVFQRQKKYNEALADFFRAKKIAKKLNDHLSEVSIIANIGNAYEDLGRKDSAKKYYYEALEIAKKHDLETQIPTTLNNLGAILNSEGKFKESEVLLNRSLAISKKMRNIKQQRFSNQGLYILNKETGRFKEALMFHEKVLMLKDSMFSVESKKSSLKRESQYEFNQKEMQTKIEQNKKDAIAEANRKKQQTILLIISVGLFIVLVLAVIIFRSLQQNKKANKIILSQKIEVEKQKDYAEEQRHLAEHQKHLVEEHQKEIIDSITYAKRLQNAILPPQDYIDKYLPDNFVLYLPKDIVAGDFYWMEHLDDITFIAAADSTGHGVPGAMVSVVCSNALNRAALEFGIRDTGKLLDKTTEIVLNTFAKSDEEIKDGMDISLLAIHHKTKKITWSGANNQLWYMLPNAGMSEITANKQPVGKSDNRKLFTTHEIDHVPGTIFYLMTDGFPDQFGGPKGKKYKYKPLQELLVNSGKLNLEDQKQILKTTFSEWRGDLEQVDDVAILGIRI